MPVRKVIIDTDPAAGLPFRDIDDALAIVYLLCLREEFDVAGLTIVAGNSPLHKGEAIAREVLSAMSREDIPVLPGSPGRRSPGPETPAAAFLAGTAAAHPGEVAVLAIGPLSNIAAAGALDPCFYRNVGRLVIMGGALREGLGPSRLPPFEFNFWKDSGAAEAVLGARCDKAVITSDVCRQVVFGRREVDAVRSMQGAPARYLSTFLEHWYRVNHVAPVPWKGGFVPWDVIAAVYLRRPELFDRAEAALRLRQGRFATGALEPCRPPSPVCPVPAEVNADGLLEDFLSVIDAGSTGIGSSPGAPCPNR